MKNRLRTLLSIQFLLILIIICSFLIQINSLVIYRRKAKPKLICHEEELLDSSSSASTQIDEAADFFLRENTEFKKSTKPQKNRNKRSQTINNKKDNEFIWNIDKEPVLNLVVSFKQF